MPVSFSFTFIQLWGIAKGIQVSVSSRGRFGGLGGCSCSGGVLGVQRGGVLGLERAGVHAHGRLQLGILRDGPTVLALVGEDLKEAAHC